MDKHNIRRFLEHNLFLFMEKSIEEISEELKNNEERFIEGVKELVLTNRDFIEAFHDDNASSDDRVKFLDKIKTQSMRVSDLLRQYKGVKRALWRDGRE